MPQRLLPVLTFSLIALSLLVAPVRHVRADAGNAGILTSSDGYTIELVFPDGQPKTGPNAALVRILDAGGQPVPNANVQLSPVARTSTEADGHGHETSGHDGATTGGHTDTHTDNASTPHAEAAGGHGHADGAEHVDIIMTQMEPGAEAGSYTSVIHFDSAGAWEVQLQFTNAGADHAARFAVTVAEPARDWRILGAFGGANALIIVAAAIMKRRFPATPTARRRATAALDES